MTDAGRDKAPFDTVCIGRSGRLSASSLEHDHRLNQPCRSRRHQTSWRDRSTFTTRAGLRHTPLSHEATKLPNEFRFSDVRPIFYKWLLPRWFRTESTASPQRAWTALPVRTTSPGRWQVAPDLPAKSGRIFLTVNAGGRDAEAETIIRKAGGDTRMPAAAKV